MYKGNVHKFCRFKNERNASITQELVPSLVHTELCIAYEKIDPTKIGNNYLVIGTMDKKVWQRNLGSKSTCGNAIDSIADFKEYLTIEFSPGGWFHTESS